MFGCDVIYLLNMGLSSPSTQYHSNAPSWADEHVVSFVTTGLTRPTSNLTSLKNFMKIEKVIFLDI